MRRLFDIADHNAVADGETVNTAAIQKTIDTCHGEGGGRVTCGPGSWLTGTLTLKSNVDLHLEAGCILKASSDLADYEDLTGPGFNPNISPEGCTKSIVKAVEASNIAITGPGTIDGSGHAFFDTSNWKPGDLFFGKPETERPRLIMFYRCKNIRLEDTHYTDAPCWTIWLMRCERVHVQRLAITGDWRLNNQDGIDIDACRDVTVSDCVLSCGDDCLVIRAMQHLYDEPVVCENVTITNCTLESRCQAIRIGCPSDGTIRNCTLSNMTITNSRNGIRFDNPRQYLVSEDGPTASVYGLVFDNIVMDCTHMPIDVSVGEGIALGRLGDLRFSNMRLRGGEPCRVFGSSETIIENVRFSNIDIETTGEDAILCRHCKNVTLTDVALTNLPSND